MNGDGPIAVVGAGIAGLTAALSLARAGFDVTLIERAERLEAVGAGVQLSPNALAVLGRLGLLGRLSRMGVGAGSVRLRSYRSGRVIADIPVASPDGAAYLAIHRSDLQEALLGAVSAEPRIRLELGTAVEGLACESGSLSLRLRGAGTASRSFALVVGADGVRSRIAAALGLPGPVESGLVAARYVAPNDLALPLDRIEAWLGPRRHAVAYPMRGGRQVNVVLIAPAMRETDAVATGFDGWDARLRALVGCGTFQGVWPLATSEPGRRLVHRGHVCLIGDAAHAMLPFAAQGAAMAIEDGFVLAQTLASDRADPERALGRFEAERLPRLKRVEKRVRFHRFTYHLPFPLALGRDATLTLRPAKALRDDLGWLYDWRPRDGAL